MKQPNEYILFKQNSELEVLISAAIVFTVFAINDVTGGLIVDALNNNVSSSSSFMFISAIVGLYMSAILPISIVSHFVLRIYWLSLVGLKAVFPQDASVYTHPKFEKQVNRSLNLERTIQQVDKICSSIFAFTFLTLFAFCFSFIAITIISVRLDAFGGILPRILMYVFLFLAFIYFIDFISLGLFKKIKNKWFLKIYHPIYVFFGWITLAFLYRGIYYSLIYHASRKVMIIITPLYIILAICLLNMGYSATSYYPDVFRGRLEGEVASTVFYKDQFPKRVIMGRPFIDSFVIPEEQNFLRVYLPLDRSLEFDLGKCESVAKFNERGVHWRNWIQTDFNRLEYDSAFSFQGNAQNILQCVADNFALSIDDEQLTGELYYFSKIDRPKDYSVIFTMLDVSDLPRGNHQLIIQQSELFGKNNTVIPFWKD